MLAKILTLGEAMAVMIAEEEGPLRNVNYYSKGLAGAELNVAVGLSRLGHKVSFLTRLGDDPFGEYIVEFANRENLDTSCIKICKGENTGMYLKEKVSKGDPKVFYYRENSAASRIAAEDLDAVDISSLDWVHLTGITPALSPSCKNAVIEAIDKARENDIPISFDPNLRPVLWEDENTMISQLNDIAVKCDIFMPGISEAKILTKLEDKSDICNYYISKGCKIVIIKLGAEGTYYKNEKGECGVIASFTVNNVVDTVGAGDGFAAGFINGILKGESIIKSVEMGNAIGAIIITSKSDNEILPTEYELKKFLEEHKID